jgi:peptidyl-prolyl cis-trans isomerase C
LEDKLAKLEVSEEEVRNAYQASLAQFTKSEKVRMAILFQELNNSMSDAKKAEIRQRMEEGLQKAKAQPATGGRGPAAGGFATLAVDYSEDQVSRYRGGDIGWLDAGNFSYRWPKPVLEAGFALELGKISGIIEAENGLYVIMKTDFRESAAAPLNEAASGLRQKLLAQKRKSLEEDFLQQTASLVKSEIHPEALAAVQLPAAANLPPKTDSTFPPSPFQGGPVSISNSEKK